MIRSSIGIKIVTFTVLAGIPIVFAPSAFAAGGDVAQVQTFIRSIIQVIAGLAGLISSERYQSKHGSFISEINDLQKQKGGVSQKYEEKYMGGIADIELSQDAKRLFADEKVNNDDKRIILTKLFEKISLKDNSVSVKYTKLTQAIARNSGKTREILGYAK